MTPPPKDRTFLANIGLPWYVVAHWNPAMDEFVYASMQVDMFEGEWNDTYFESDYLNESDIRSWIELPKIEEKSDAM